MRRLSFVLLAALGPSAMWAQDRPPITTTPLMPPSRQFPPVQPGTPPALQSPPSPAPETAQPTPSPEPNPWIPQGSAVLQVLDKPNAQSTSLTVKVGQTVTYGSLSITVRACFVRPPDMPQDATAFLEITDQHGDEPSFRGWMVRSDPSLQMLQHPIYDVRVLGCAP